MSHDIDTERLQRLLEGETLQPEDRAWLHQLTDQPQGIESLRRHLHLHGLLSIALEDAQKQDRTLHQSMAKILDADSTSFFTLVQLRLARGRRRQLRHKIALAASFTLATGIALMMLTRHQQHAATLLRAESANWDHTSPAHVGDSFAVGSTLKLLSGLIKLQFANYGTMIVEGPAELVIINPRQAQLRSGRLVMRVSDAGHGFRIETPSGSIIDKGTEFGVAVSANGSVETSVIEGQIEAKPRGANKVLLHSNESLQLHNGQHRHDAIFSYYTSMPPLHEGRPAYVHWSLDDADNTSLKAESRGFSNPGALILNKRSAASSTGEYSLPSATPGVAGQALHFDGKSNFGECDFRGIGGSDPRTVCFWVRVPSQFQIEEGYAMLSWGHFLNHSFGTVWQISANPEAADGPLGCLRVGTHGGEVIGTTDLRDDQWHHIAVVMYPGSRPNVGKHVFLYVDGKLDPVSQRSLREINTEVASASHGVLFGRDVSQTARPNSSPNGFFRGDLDEVFIVAAALSQSEIQHIMSHHRLPE